MLACGDADEHHGQRHSATLTHCRLIINTSLPALHPGADYEASFATRQQGDLLPRAGLASVPRKDTQISWSAVVYTQHSRSPTCHTPLAQLMVPHQSPTWAA